MFIKKNRFLFFLILFIITLQILTNCSGVYAYEKQEVKVSSSKPIIEALNNKPEVKKSYKKKATRTNYRKKNEINVLPVKPIAQTNVGLSKNVISKKIEKLPNVYTEKKQLNLADFPGKKDTLEKIPKDKPVKGVSFLSVLSSLFFVILLVLIFGWFYSKLRNVDPAALLAGKLSEKSLNKFNILSTATLGQGKNVHLIEINGKYLVIGSTINNINLLTELNPDKIDQIEDINDSEPIIEDNNDFIERDVSNYNDVYKEYLKEQDTKPK
ncbi:MAG: flagellar biosynthetic protein FliO [Candidatus Gastranaerophilales bacterium]|nr:flagellar biosynthetic protein FliO [Candidatus Gastranaerophilales bacterium]